MQRVRRSWRRRCRRMSPLCVSRLTIGLHGCQDSQNQAGMPPRWPTSIRNIGAFFTCRSLKRMVTQVRYVLDLSSLIFYDCIINLLIGLPIKLPTTLPISIDILNIPHTQITEPNYLVDSNPIALGPQGPHGGPCSAYNSDFLFRSVN